MTDGLRCNVKLFADDIIFASVYDPIIAADDLNHDLNSINKWARKWKMKYAVEVAFPQKVITYISHTDFFNYNLCQKSRNIEAILRLFV